MSERNRDDQTQPAWRAHGDMQDASKDAMLDEEAVIENERIPSSDAQADDVELEAPKDTWKTAKRLAGQLRNQRGRLILVMVLVFVQMLFHVGAPLYSVGVVNNLWAAIKDAWAGGTPFMLSFAYGGVGWQILILALLYMGEAAFYYLPVYLMASVAERLNLTLRTQISAKLAKLPLSFFDANKPGEVLSKVTNDLDRISETMQTGLLRLISAIITTVLALIIMAVLSWQLTLVFVAFLALNLAITRTVAARTLAVTSARQHEIGKLTGLVEEYYTGRDIIRGANWQESSVQQVRQQTEHVRAVSQKADFLVNCVNPLIRMFNRFSMVVIALISAWMMAHGRMTIGVVQAFYQYVNLVGEPITEASFMINSLQSSLASAERTFELLDAPEETPDPVHPLVPAEPVQGRVVFDHVRFGYDPDHPLMTDVNITAQPGRKIAIVGSTGAGKTTLINLLMRFYDIDAGLITLDGVDTSAMTRAELRRHFGMVLQDTWLFNGTVADNLKYGRPDATREQVEQAAKAAHIDHFIRTLPQGYDTVLGDEAASLSVGQRQLMTIARVFLADPAMLILDEATSSVDTRTEAAIAKATDALMHGRTSFVIAHRLSTIRDADLILVMDHGDIIEQGTHEQLLAADGRYAKLYRSQFA